MSRPPLSKRRPVCVHCGAVYGQRDTHDVTLRWEDGQPEPRYAGNLTVVKSSAVRKFTPAMSLPLRGDRMREITAEIPAQPNARDLQVWDGQTWFGGYHPFCTLRCALAYARKAWAKS